MVDPRPKIAEEANRRQLSSLPQGVRSRNDHPVAMPVPIVLPALEPKPAAGRRP